jgi:predicted metal-binding membrane protein
VPHHFHIDAVDDRRVYPMMSVSNEPEHLEADDSQINRQSVIAVRVLVVLLPFMAWISLALLALDPDVCRAALFSLTQSGTVDSETLNQLIVPFTRPVIIFSNSLHPFLLLWLMWIIMAIAMMLPTASRMLTTYANIAGAAAQKQIYAPSIYILAAGYLSVWIGFGFLATITQIHVNGWMGRYLLDHGPWPPMLSGALFLTAGLWQLTPLKQICLTKCHNPFPILFSRWSNNPTRIYRLGIEQGIYCLGCCWAIMLVMFAVGTMNLLWMAVAGLAMGWEKSSKNKLVPAIISSLLVLIGIATLVAAYQAI